MSRTVGDLTRDLQGINSSLEVRAYPVAGERPLTRQIGRLFVGYVCTNPEHDDKTVVDMSKTCHSLDDLELVVLLEV